MCSPFGPRMGGDGREDTSKEGRLVNYQSLSPSLSPHPRVYFLKSRLKYSKSYGVDHVVSGLPYTRRRITGGYFRHGTGVDGSGVTLDSETDTQGVLPIPTSLCSSARDKEVPMHLLSKQKGTWARVYEPMTNGQNQGLPRRVPEH